MSAGEQMKVRIYKTASVDPEVAVKICTQLLEFMEEAGFKFESPGDGAETLHAVRMMFADKPDWAWSDLAELYVKNQIERD